MESILENLVAWLPDGWPYYTLLFAAALFESLVLVGLLVPGSTLIVFAGFLAAHGKGDLLPLILLSLAAAMLGDLTSYLLGARIGPQLLYSRQFRKHLKLVRKAEIFFNAHGGKSLFFGRFIGPLRGMVPFIAGCTRMPPSSFLAYTVISSMLWGLVYPGVGFLGAASWQKIQVLTGRFSLLLGSLLVLFILNGLFWKKVFPRLVDRLTNWWPRIVSNWNRLLQTPIIKGFAERFPRLWAFLAGRFSLKRGSGLYLTVGFTISALFSWLFFRLVDNIRFFRHFDQQIYQLLSQYRHPLADGIMIMITSLGDLEVLLLISGFVFLWLVLHNRDFSAVILIVGVGGGQALVALLKGLYTHERPLPFLEELQMTSFSFPSGHAFSSLVLAGLLVYFLINTVKVWRLRLGLIIGASFLALLVGLSRCYLGVHWLRDVLAGFVLAAVWLTVLFTVLEIRRRYAGEFPWGTGWKPVKLSPLLRRLILLPAFCLTFFAVMYHAMSRAGLV